MGVSAPGRRRPTAALGLLAVLAATSWPYVVPSAFAHRTGVQLLSLVLVGLSLTITVGWLRAISLFQPAAAAIGAGVTATLLTRDHSVGVAFVLATAGGAAVGLITLAVAVADPKRWLPPISLAVTAVVAVLVDQWVLRAFRRPTLLDIELSDDRALYLVGLAVTAAACLLVTRLRRTDLGRQLLAVGAGTLFASRRGVAAGAVQAQGIALSGALAGAAGWLTSLLHQGLPSPLEFAPVTAVAYLAIPVVGGVWSTAGALIGASLFLGATRLALLAGTSTLSVVAAALVVATMWWHPDGVAGLLGSRKPVLRLRRMLAGER